MDDLDKYKNSPLCLQAWQEGYEEGLDQCHISSRLIWWAATFAVLIVLIGVSYD
tara:strand:+ start:19 stop:180 length:162 start_codon:yes stop_codon:yes gene_type:complete